MRLDQLCRQLRQLPERQHWGPGKIRSTVVQRRELPTVTDDLSAVYRWLWLIDGEVICSDEHGNNYVMKPGDCFIRAPDQPHRVDRPLQNNYLELAVTIPRLQWQALCELELIDPDQRFIRFGDDPELHALFWRWFSGLDSLSSVQGRSHSMHLLHELLAFLQPSTSRLSGGERQLLRLLQQELCAEVNRNIALEDIAAEHAISMDQMRYLFREELGCLPKEFQIRRRCEAAAELLLDPQHSIAAVAEQLDYPDPFAFSKQFRKVMGLSPRAYRQQNA